MAFTVEDGTGVDNANSYVAVADCDTYHSDRGNAAWTGSDAVKQAALIKATDYVEQTFGERWQGKQNDVPQALKWPRYSVIVDGIYLDSDEIPQRLKDAVCVLALEALTADLNPALARGGAIQSEKVDVIETVYMSGASARTVRPAVEGLLAPLFGAGSGFNVKAVRV